MIRRLAFDITPALLAFAAVGATLILATPVETLPSWGGQCYASTDCRPAADREAEETPSDEAALENAAAQATLESQFAECWDASTGRVGTHVVARSVETGAVAAWPLDQAWPLAQAGEIVVLAACQA